MKVGGTDKNTKNDKGGDDLMSSLTKALELRRKGILLVEFQSHAKSSSVNNFFMDLEKGEKIISKK